jgi:hypothetical protein
MAQPASILNTRGQSTDTLIGADGTGRVKMGVGNLDLAGLTNDGAGQLVGTHPDGATFATSDPVVVLAGIEGTTVRTVLVDASGRPLVVTAPSGGNLTDCSGTITEGGTSQELVAALTTRKYLLIQNLSDEVMWINFGADAEADSGSIKLAVASDPFIMQGSFVSTQTVNIVSATTGKAYTAKEG